MREIGYQSFFDFERDHDLFNRKTDEGFLYWDVLRFPISMYLFYGKEYFDDPPIRKSKLSTILTYLRLGTLSAFILTAKWIAGTVSRSPLSIFVIATRYKIEGKSTDIITRDDVKATPNKLVIESLISERTGGTIPDLRYLFGRFVKVGRFSRTEFDFINDAFSKDFGQQLDYEFVNSIFSAFWIDRIIYRTFFRWMRPTAMYINQNGFRKGIFAAAIDRGVMATEYQHGFINSSHLSYSYPPWAGGVRDRIFLPATVMLFSNTWLRQMKYEPLYKTTEIGNNYNSGLPKPAVDLQPCDLLVITSKGIDRFIIDFMRAHRETFARYGRIYLKCHPNQDRTSVHERYAEFPNVTIYFNEHNLQQLILVSKTLLTIDSTVVYEALQMGKPVYIIKKGTYFMHENLFGDPNVKFIDTVHEIDPAVKFIPGDYMFFKPRVQTQLTGAPNTLGK